MEMFKPKGTIEKVGDRLIKKTLKDEEGSIFLKSETAEIIKCIILFHFENIKKNYITLDKYLEI
jgi:hypothetical protein